MGLTTPAVGIKVRYTPCLRSIQLKHSVSVCEKVIFVKTDGLGDIERFNQRYPSTVPLDELLLINGLEPNAVMTAGTRVKRVVGEGVPEE